MHTDTYSTGTELGEPIVNYFPIPDATETKLEKLAKRGRGERGKSHSKRRMPAGKTTRHGTARKKAKHKKGGPGPTRSGPGPTRPGPGPTRPGPGPTQGGPGPTQGGPGPTQGGPGPTRPGPGPTQPGPGPTQGGPGPTQGGPGPTRPGPGPTQPGPGPTRPGPGPTQVGVEPGLATAELMNGHNFVLLPEFLMPDELASLREYTFAREADFEASYVVAPGSNRSTVDPSHRRSRVLFDIGRVGALLVERLRFYLDRVVRELNCEPFPVSEVEAQITASNDGDFFHVHADNHEAPLRSRELTFVYFFHGEPRRFRGGELRIYGPAETGTFETIVPEQNQLVVFRSRLLHEVRPVRCPSRHFADSRFTLNGWFRR